MTTEQIIEEYKKKFALCDNGGIDCDCKGEIKFIKKVLQQVRQDAIRECEQKYKKKGISFE